MEQGGWIRKRPWYAFGGNKYSVERWSTSGVHSSGRAIASRSHIYPTKRPSRVVGAFHTHPNTRVEGYYSRPGISDITNTSKFFKATHAVLTHDGVKWIGYP